MRSCGSSVPVEQTAEQVTAVHLGRVVVGDSPRTRDRGARVSYDGWWAGGMAEELGDPMDGGP
jgi:hypothetical protein